MTTTTQHDLSRLTIERDASPGPRRGFLRTLLFAGVAVALIATIAVVVRRGAAVPVQVAVAVASDGEGSAGVGTDGGATAVTANGYVVARTRASVSAKVAGRLAQLDVSEGSFVREGVIIARLENADYQAQIGRAHV